MNKQTQGDYDKALEHSAAEGGDIQECFFCLDPVHVDQLAGAPIGSSQEISDLYMQRPRCIMCDIDIRMRVNDALLKGLADCVSSYKPTCVVHPGIERSEDEKQALDAIYAEQDHQALTELDIDKLHQEKGDGRYWP